MQWWEGLIEVSKDGIYLIHDDGRLVEMEPELWASEDELQELLANYPSVWAGSQINTAAPTRGLRVAREAGVRARQGGRTRAGKRRSGRGFKRSGG